MVLPRARSDELFRHQNKFELPPAWVQALTSTKQLSCEEIDEKYPSQHTYSLSLSLYGVYQEQSRGSLINLSPAGGGGGFYCTGMVLLVLLVVPRLLFCSSEVVEVCQGRLHSIRLGNFEVFQRYSGPKKNLKGPHKDLFFLLIPDFYTEATEMMPPLSC